MTRQGSKTTHIGKTGPEDGIGRRIQAARNKKGLKAAELARLAGIHRATLKHYETGDRFPGAKELRRICDALGKSPNELIYGNDIPVSFDVPPNRGDFADWTIRFPALMRAISGYLRLPVNDQLAFAHLINSTADQYYNSGEREKMEEFIQVMMPAVDAIVADDKDEFMRLVYKMRDDLDSGAEDKQ